MPKLTDTQIQKKLTEGRNYKRLYFELKVKYDEVVAENKILKVQLAIANAKLVTQAIQIAELQTMVFGKKKRPPSGETSLSRDTNKKNQDKRSKLSYRRPIPPATAITKTEIVSVDNCRCGGSLKNTTTHERYQKDIPLPELTQGYQANLVTRYIISRGICSRCGKVTSAKDLGGQIVTLGPNVRLLICHLVTVLCMSYTQVINLIFSLYGIHMADGEIANTLAKQHKNWLPDYEHLKNDIRSSPVVHVDETPWKIQANDGLGYAWSLSDANSQKVYFSLENSRGARHAKKLFGADTNKPFSGIRISDDYGGYRSSTLPGKQQLCWAHLYRCIRDLRYNSNIPKEQVTYVTWWFEQFANIYQDLRTYLDQPYNKQTRATQSNALWQRLQPLTQTAEQASIAEISDPNEPKKLKRLKAQLLRAGQEKLFTCLIYDTPCDNNRAERDLRQLVLKRKRSFGSQTEKGATALSTILSLCTTTWRMQPNGYFRALAELG